MSKRPKQLAAVLAGSISVLPTYVAIANFRGGEHFFPPWWFGAFGVVVALIVLAVIAVPFDNWLRARGEANWLWHLVLGAIVAPAAVVAVYLFDGWSLKEAVARVVTFGL